MASKTAADLLLVLDGLYSEWKDSADNKLYNQFVKTRRLIVELELLQPGQAVCIGDRVWAMTHDTEERGDFSDRSPLIPFELTLP
jgi:hypothetical protein